MRQEPKQEHATRGTQRAASLGGHGVLVAGGLSLGLLARGPLERIGTATADTPDVGLAFAALPLLTLAVCFVAYGMRLDRSLGEAPLLRWTAAIVLVCALAPFDRLGAYGLAVNLAAGSAAAAAVLAAHARGRVR